MGKCSYIVTAKPRGEQRDTISLPLKTKKKARVFVERLKEENKLGKDYHGILWGNPRIKKIRS